MSDRRDPPHSTSGGPRPPRRRPRGEPGRSLPGLPVAEDVERELDFHLDMRTRELMETGLDEEAARREALRSFGDRDSISTSCRNISGAPDPGDRTHMLETALRDLRYALRTLAREPGFVAVTVLTLALGIGANTAIFSAVNGVLLQPLPYPEPDRLVALWELDRQGRANNIAAPNFFDWQSGNSSFVSMAMMPTYRFGGRATVLGGETPVRVHVGGVTRDFFATMGVEPAIGRTFSAEEAQEDATPVVVVSHAYWATQLGADPDLSDRQLGIFGSTAQVIGVMPQGFHFPGETDVWFPSEIFGFGASRTSHNYAAVGRLRGGVSVEAARAELDAIGAALLEQFGEDTDAVGVVVQPLLDELVGDSRRPLLLLLGAAVLVLLVGCTNLASALLARGAGRQREIAVRASLGASRGRILLQLLAESVVLTALGVVAGLLVATAALRGLIAMAPAALPRAEAIGVDGGALLFTLILSALTTLAFGLLPAWRLAHGDVNVALRSGSRGNASGRGPWGLLVAAEVALALVLLIGAGLLIKSFWGVLTRDPGFDARGVLTADMSVPSTLYPDDDGAREFLDRVLAELGSLPGVTDVGLVSHLPLSGASINGSLDVEGREPGAGYADYRVAGGDYFEAMGIPLLAGRTFAPSDDATAPHVAVINAELARRLWPGEDAVGRRVSNLANDAWVYGRDPITIIGVVGNVRHHALTREPPAELYVHYRQRPMRARGAILAVRSARDPVDLVAAVRGRITALDHNVPVDFATMSSRLAGSEVDRRFTMIVLASFAVVALALSAVGIYGVVSYSVARRRREMGIRLALGEPPSRVRASVVRESLRTVLVGAAFGLVGAIALTRVIESLLHEVSPTDPTTIAGVVVILLACAWIASVIPARRTASIDPMMTMRAD